MEGHGITRLESISPPASVLDQFRVGCEEEKLDVEIIIDLLQLVYEKRKETNKFCFKSKLKFRISPR